MESKSVLAGLVFTGGRDANFSKEKTKCVGEEGYDANAPQRSLVHLRKQMRGGRQCLTIVEGLAPDLDQHKILKFLRKHLACNGCVQKNEEEDVIVMQGDVRGVIKAFFVERHICEAPRVVMHGA
jgi:translation initiation factor SUI1